MVARMKIDAGSWALYALVALLWLASAALIDGRRESGWTAIPRSLFGFIWVGFGLDVVFRFLVLQPG